MATAKQIAFIESLIARTGDAGKTLAAEAGQIDDLTTRQASALISDLLALPTVSKTAPAKSEDFDWSRTEKQMAFICSLIEKIGTAAQTVVEEIAGDHVLDSLSKTQASALIEALIDFRDTHATTTTENTAEEPRATRAQANKIWKLVLAGAHTEGGFYNGPTTWDGITALTRTAASHYIDSLTAAY